MVQSREPLIILVSVVKIFNSFTFNNSFIFNCYYGILILSSSSFDLESL